MESLLYAEAQNSLAQEIDRSRLQVTPKNGKDGPMGYGPDQKNKPTISTFLLLL